MEYSVEELKNALIERCEKEIATAKFMIFPVFL